MNIAIYDKNGGDHFEQKARAAAKKIFIGAEVPELCLDINQAAMELCKHQLIVAHLSETQWNALIEGSLASVQLIVRVSNMGQSGMSSYRSPYQLPNNGPWILHLRDRPVEVLPERWEVMFKVLKDWDRSQPGISKGVASIFNPHPEVLFALRLLCEAWVFVHKKRTVDGITIRAPETPDHWFNPFEKIPPSPLKSNSEQEKKRINEELAPLVGLMGEAEAEALKLLTAVVNGDELNEPVETFLNRFKGSKQAATNRIA